MEYCSERAVSSFDARSASSRARISCCSTLSSRKVSDVFSDSSVRALDSVSEFFVRRSLSVVRSVLTSSVAVSVQCRVGVAEVARTVLRCGVLLHARDDGEKVAFLALNVCHARLERLDFRARG